jgi:hypothetical protein
VGPPELCGWLAAGGGRKEKGRRKEVGGAHRGKMVISRLGLTLLAQKMDGMA